jgi:hypothetical protein
LFRIQGASEILGRGVGARFTIPEGGPRLLRAYNPGCSRSVWVCPRFMAIA